MGDPPIARACRPGAGLGDNRYGLHTLSVPLHPFGGCTADRGSGRDGDVCRGGEQYVRDGSHSGRRAFGALVGVVVAQLVLNRAYANIGLPMADARIIAVAALVALAVVLLASVSPARRAASVDPMEALRAE